VSEEIDGMFPVVGIGASAGGLEAFTSLVSALTDNTGMAFVAVPHLDPNHPSALADILARSTSMPVVEIVDGQAIAPNTIYVLPPGQDLTIEDTTLELQPRSVGAPHHPIDLFFRSLAEARRHQAIGVVLSGTATDGTLGVRAIKGAGGITFAQDDSARQTSMPHSAIADGFVDFVLSPVAIGTELVRIGRSPRTLEHASVPPVDERAQVAEIFWPEKGKGRTYVISAFNQAYTYARDYNEPVAYLVIYKMSKEEPRFLVPDAATMFPCASVNNKTVFFVVVDICEHGAPASKRGPLKSIEISEADLIRSIEPGESAMSTEAVGS
jgi:hypothetical protein